MVFRDSWKCKWFGHNHEPCFEIRSEGVVYAYLECSRCDSCKVVADLSEHNLGVQLAIRHLLYAIYGADISD